MKKIAYILSLICAACFLSACDPEPAPKTPPPPVKKEQSADPAWRVADRSATMMTLSSNLGALHHCRAAAIYDSPIVEDTYYRVRGIMMRLAKEGEQGNALASIAYAAYVRSFNEGVLFTITVPVKDNPEYKFKVDATPIMSRESCKGVEATLAALRAKGQMLDVPPDREGLDEGPKPAPKKGLPI